MANGFHRGEILQLTADFIVVALERFLLLLHILLQLACLRESNAVHAAQRIVFRLAAPVSTGGVRQLHRLYCARAHQVRAGAKVGVISLRINGKLPALFGILFQQFQLIRLVCKQLAAFLQADDALLNRQIRLDDFLHLGFDGGELIRRKGRRTADIIVPAVFQRRADAEMCLGIKVLNCLCHDVRRRMPESVFPLIVGKSEDIHRTIFVHGCAQILCLAVDAYCTGRLIKAHADAFCDVSRGNARLKFLDNAIF